MSQYSGYGNPYYGEGSGSSFHNFEDKLPPHGYPRIYPEYQTPYDVNTSRSTPQSSYMQDHARSDYDHRNFLDPENEYQVPTTTFPSGSYSIKGKERQSHDFGQSPHSEIQSFKGKERQYQDFEESLDGDKTTSPRRSGLRYEGLLKQHPLRDFDTVGEIKQAQNQTGISTSTERTSSTRRTGCKYKVLGRFSTRTNIWSLFDHKELEMIHNLSAVEDINEPDTVLELRVKNDLD
ncbi:hypothetical protein BY996DRAFT_6519537 [Phakopsora pachyrhizi]|nr:hypothetical protein BY996DRAFT_6519537 [Phakopsora pachyrhizi]